jgi:pantoate--beta-alanine ligase
VEIVSTVAALRSRLAGAARIALVPTMGNLHAGHLGLMRLAHDHAETVVASIFVNRLQFAPHEDFERYPRTFDADCAGLAGQGVDVLFAPLEQEMYPEPQRFRVETPPMGLELEGAFRPGFFEGVCTVVLKLFNMVRPAVAVFGEKDLQQLTLLRGMVRQFNLPITIVAAPTARADDGLALSSRNGYLTAAERDEAPALSRALREAAASLASGERDVALVEAQATGTLARRGWKVDYVAVRNVRDLSLPHASSDSRETLVVLGAATLGSTRLIDNVTLA